MTNQMIRSLERRPDKTTTDGKKSPPILLLLDEIARFGKVSSLVEGITTLRSKGVTFALNVQSLAQFDLHYGANERKIIAGNCQYKAIINVIEPDSQDYYSRILGSSEVKKMSYSRSYGEMGLKETGRSKSWSFVREPYMQTHEFGVLDDEIVLMTPKGYCRVDKYFAPRLDDLRITAETLAEDEVGKIETADKKAAAEPKEPDLMETEKTAEGENEAPETAVTEPKDEISK